MTHNASSDASDSGRRSDERDYRPQPAPKVAKAIREKARKERLSINKAVIKLLEDATGATQETRKIVHHDLDRFFGTWTREEADAFDEALREQRQIEPEMWK